MALSLTINKVNVAASFAAGATVANAVASGGTAPYVYSLATGGDKFAINSSTGAVTTIANMDASNIASFSVTATDSTTGTPLTITSDITYPPIQAAIQSKFNKGSVIYKITKPINLYGGVLTIPEGCTLDFQGGSIDNGLIVFNNTTIKNEPIFGPDIDVQGLSSIEGVYPEFFGYRDFLTPTQKAAVFKRYTNYVNSTNGCYFKITNRGYYYHLYDPFYSEKSIIGVDNPKFLYMEESIGKVVSETKKTAGGKFDFNVKAVFAVNQLTESDMQNRFTIENLIIYCNQGEDKAGQDIGFYFPHGNSFSMKNVAVINAGVASFQFIENWMSTLTLLNSWNSYGVGFKFLKDNYGGTFTSLHVTSCYSHTAKDSGFKVNGAMYSTFSDLGNDGCTGETAYSFASCYGTSYFNLGSESSTVNTMFYIGDCYGSISGIYTLGNTIKHSYFTFHSNGSLMEIGGMYNQGLIAGEGNVYSYEILLGASDLKPLRVLVHDTQLMTCTNKTIGMNANVVNGYILFDDAKGGQRGVVNNAETFNPIPTYGSYSNMPKPALNQWYGQRYLLTDYGFPAWWNGEVFLDSDGRFPRIKTGTTAQRPEMVGYGYTTGHLYYDTTLGKPIWWNGTRWVDNMGFPAGLTRGTTAQRPSLGESDYGYMYYDNELMKYITWSGLTWMNINGTSLT